MKIVRSFFIILIIVQQTLYASSLKEIDQKFKKAKMNYLRAVLNSHTDHKIKHLNELIQYGNKLKLNTQKYQKELERYQTSQKKPPLVTQSSSNNQITAIYSYKNGIRIDFKHRISKQTLRFFQRKSALYHEDHFDIKGDYSKPLSSLRLTLKGIQTVNVSRPKKEVVRISILNPSQPNTYYVINQKTILIKLRSSLKQTNTQQVNRYLNRKKTIVIDPGHGGKDPGAVGPKNRYEKVVVLNISKYLYEELRKRGYTIHLTRTRDRFVQLRNRTKFSNLKKTDIFISIHANAARKSRVKQAQGIETFFLSPARSDRAKRVAANENKSDIRTMNHSTQNSLLTILNQSKITQSNKLAIDIQQNLLQAARSRYKDIIDGGVREGPFWVLVGAQMPSILVEVGYISHPKESTRLYLSSYQKLLAMGIANGIDDYFSKNE